MKIRLQCRSTLFPHFPRRAISLGAFADAKVQPNSRGKRSFTSTRPHHFHPFSQSQSQLRATQPVSPPPNPSHWLSAQKSRIGKCILFGLSTPQLALCSQILEILSTEWRLLVAGREGFVRAGLQRHKVVWGEMDSMGHVNNVVYVRYAETGRVEWLCGLGAKNGEGTEWRELMTPRGEKGLILRSIKVDFKFPMKYPDHISVFHKLRSSPSTSNDDPSSFILDVLILSELHQRPAARCEEDIVVYDYQAGKKVPISGFMAEGFERIWLEQEKERKRAESRINEVEALVGRLEAESWAKEGAIEDMGGKK